MVEVRSLAQSTKALCQLVLKRLTAAQQVLERLLCVETVMTTAEQNGFAVAAALEGTGKDAE